VVGFKFRGCVLPLRFAPNFLLHLAVKLCFWCEHVLEVQEWYGPLLSPCQVWWGRTSRAVGGRKVLCFLKVFLSFFVCLFVRHTVDDKV